MLSDVPLWLPYWHRGKATGKPEKARIKMGLRVRRLERVS
jgi:hypothetical protein